MIYVSLSLVVVDCLCLSVQSFDERKGGKGEAGRWEKCVCAYVLCGMAMKSVSFVFQGRRKRI